MAKNTKKAAAKPSAKKKAAPKAPKALKEPKVKAAKPSKTGGSNSIDPKLREVFLADKAAYLKAKEKLSLAQRGMQNIGKTIKADGFTMRQIKFACELDTPEGEAAARLNMASYLVAARYTGSALGNHLDVFLDDVDMRPAVDRAYDEGTKDSMENKRSDPSKYHTTTPQHAAYLKGFQDDTARRVREGIKAPEGEKTLITKDEKAAGDKAKLEADAAREKANAPVPPVPTSGNVTSRSEYLKQKEAKSAAEAIFDVPKATA